MGAPIPSLRGTPMYMTAVELYQAHRSDGASNCIRCRQRVPCPVRSNAAAVIATAGEDPGWYDGRFPPPVPPSRIGDLRPAVEPSAGPALPNRYGYTVGERPTGAIPKGSAYERGT
jgi:hypothetical protein